MAQAPKCKACGKSHWGACAVSSRVPDPAPVESGGVDVLSVLRRLVARIHAGGPIRGTDEHLEACRVVGVEPCRSPLKKYPSASARQKAYRERKRKGGS